MFDIGFSELLLFGVIALVVLGPEKLPQAARTAGRWYAKLRRTIATIQTEIEAELDLAETRQKMQEELAKIRQAEADMKREMAELRGSMREFEKAQNQSLSTEHPSQHKTEHKPPAHPHSADSLTADAAQTTPDLTDLAPAPVNDIDSAHMGHTPSYSEVALTRPWEQMWFRLGEYDKARRLPPAPFCANYRADALLYVSSRPIQTDIAATDAPLPPSYGGDT